MSAAVLIRFCMGITVARPFPSMLIDKHVGSIRGRAERAVAYSFRFLAHSSVSTVIRAVVREGDCDALDVE
jgi:hypothetical protein